MNIHTLSVIKSKFVSRVVGTEMVLVPLSNNVAQMNQLFTLNETGRFIWENTSADSTLDQLCAAMTEAFEIDEKTARQDIEGFIAKLNAML